MKLSLCALGSALVLVSTCAFGQSTLLTIRNETLEVDYDASSGHFAVSSVASQGAFLTDGQFNGPHSLAKIVTADDPILGTGRSITVVRTDGGSEQIQLYPGLSFVLFRTALHNLTGEPMVVQSFRPWSASTELGLPAASLVTLGTGGLLAPDKNPGSYMWLAVADPGTRKGIVAGWLTSDRGTGVLFSREVDGHVALSAQIDYGRMSILARKSEALETLAVGYFPDARLGLESWADLVAKVHKIKLPAQPTVYCTWYAPKPYGAASSATHLAELADFADKEVKPYGLSVIQIDDHWQSGISHDGPKRDFTKVDPQGPYPAGMKATADKLSEQGFVPGLWFLPFAGTSYDPVYKDHQDWFVKTADGKPYEVKWGGTCLDMTYAPAREHVRDVVSRIVHDWGFRYIKIDGLWTGTATKEEYINSGYKDDGMGDAVFSNPNKTNVEAFRDGLKLVREAAGPGVYINGCNTPQNMRTYGAAMGLVDGMRIGPDNKADWKSMLRGPEFGSRQYFLHGRVWYNDPDPIYVRAEVPLAEARALCSWDAISGQLNTSSEWYPGLPADRLDLLRRTMPSHHFVARPVDLFDSPIPRIWLIEGAGASVGRNLVGLFNWSDKPSEIDCPLDRLGFAADATVAMFEYWDNHLLAPQKGVLRLTVPARSCMVLSIRDAAQRPQLIGSSRSITQGLSDIQLESWDSESKTLSGYSNVTAGDPYELRIIRGSFVVTKAVALLEGGEMPMTCRDDGELARASFTANQSGAIGWKIQFR